MAYEPAVPAGRSAARVSLTAVIVGIAALAVAAVPTPAAAQIEFCGPSDRACGHLSVPLDYSKPRGTKIQLAVSRIRHTVPDSQSQGVMLVNPQKHPDVKKELGQAFIDWLVSPEGQQTIAEYKIDGEQLFFPNATVPGA